MFSYQHVFHAGNHADVLKHVVLAEVLDYVCKKEGTIFYIDTHAGSGLYRLRSAAAQKNREYESGIARLFGQKKLTGELETYISLIRELNPDGVLRLYPGSPYIASKLLREQDRIRLFELHPAEIRSLAGNFKKMDARAEGDVKNRKTRGKRVIIEKKDGFTALKAQLPPPSRRAVIFIDPPYENRQDYRFVREALLDALKRFSSGTYIVWYPIIERPEARRFLEQLKSLSKNEWLNVSLAVREPAAGRPGLLGSALFIINPPWVLDAYLKKLMPELVTLLGQSSLAGFSISRSQPSRIQA